MVSRQKNGEDSHDRVSPISIQNDKNNSDMSKMSCLFPSIRG